MTSTIQILPPATPRSRDAAPAATGDAVRQDGGKTQGSLGALVRVSGFRAETARTPLFSHVGNSNLPNTSIGFLAQHLAQEWTARDNALDAHRVTAAYGRPVAANDVELLATA